MVVSSSSPLTLPLNTMVHMLTIKLTSSNYLLWRNRFLLYSSLTEESMSEVLGFHHSHEAWHALEVSFSHRSKTRELQLKDELQLMHRLCDQPAIGRPIDNTDKVHYHEIFERSVPIHLPTRLFCAKTSKVDGHKQVKHWSSTSPTPFANSKSSSNSSVHRLCDKEGHLAKRSGISNSRRSNRLTLPRPFLLDSILITRMVPDSMQRPT
ncbi:hypothetical protein AAG906_040147 [Vitis piasezkii]